MFTPHVIFTVIELSIFSKQYLSMFNILCFLPWGNMFNLQSQNSLSCPYKEKRIENGIKVCCVFGILLFDFLVRWYLVWLVYSDFFGILFGCYLGLCFMSCKYPIPWFFMVNKICLLLRKYIYIYIWLVRGEIIVELKQCRGYGMNHFCTTWRTIDSALGHLEL